MNTIYKLYCKDENVKDFYIGSSKNFKGRKYKHNSDCNNENGKAYNIKLYKFIRANGGYNNFDYEILLKTEFDDIKILEQEYIKELQPTLNCCNACGLNKIKKKEYNKEYQKQSYQKNKEKIKEYQKQRYQKNKEKILKKNV